MLIHNPLSIWEIIKIIKKYIKILMYKDLWCVTRCDLKTFRRPISFTKVLTLISFNDDFPPETSFLRSAAPGGQMIFQYRSDSCVQILTNYLTSTIKTLCSNTMLHFMNWMKIMFRFKMFSIMKRVLSWNKRTIKWRISCCQNLLCFVYVISYCLEICEERLVL